jgi:hypothetical protein
LWRRLEKDAENLLIGVDETGEVTPGRLAWTLFSAILTKCHLARDTVSRLYDSSFCGFHRFTALITTTSFIIFQNLEKSLAVLIAVVDSCV